MAYKDVSRNGFQFKMGGNGSFMLAGLALALYLFFMMGVKALLLAGIFVVLLVASIWVPFVGALLAPVAMGGLVSSIFIFFGWLAVNLWNGLGFTGAI